MWEFAFVPLSTESLFEKCTHHRLRVSSCKQKNQKPDSTPFHITLCQAMHLTLSLPSASKTDFTLSKARQFYWGMLNIDKRRSDTLHNSKHKPPVCNFSKGGCPTCWQFLSNGFKNFSQLILFLPLLFLCLFLCNTQFNSEKPYWLDKKSNTE